MANHPLYDEITMTKRGNVWQYRFYVSSTMNNGGKAFDNRKSTGKTDFKDACKIAATAFDTFQSTTSDGEQVTLSGKPTVHDSFEAAKAHDRVRIAAGQISKDTWANVAKYYHLHIEDYFGKKTVDSVNTSMWNDFLADLLKRKPNLRPDTIRLTKGALRACLKAAVNKGYIDDIPTLKDGFKTNNNKTKRIWFDYRDQHKLLVILNQNVESLTRKSNQYSAMSLLDFCELMLLTGLRPHEMWIIRFSDVSIENERVGKNKFIHRVIIEVPSKGGAKTGARIAIGENGSAQVYKRILERRGLDKNSNELLFDQKHHSKFRQILEDNNLRFDKDNNKRDFESLRHSYISNRILEKMDVYEVAKRCGNSPKVIHEHYARFITSLDFSKYKKFQRAVKEKQKLASEFDADWD